MVGLIQTKVGGEDPKPPPEPPPENKEGGVDPTKVGDEDPKPPLDKKMVGLIQQKSAVKF